LSVHGLLDGEQHDIAEEYLRSFTANWNVPTDLFVERAEDALREFIRKTVDFLFGRFSPGGLPFHMWCGNFLSADVIVLIISQK
jgi:hypothetical protein